MIKRHFIFFLIFTGQINCSFLQKIKHFSNQARTFVWKTPLRKIATIFLATQTLHTMSLTIIAVCITEKKKGLGKLKLLYEIPWGIWVGECKRDMVDGILSISRFLINFNKCAKQDRDSKIEQLEKSEKLFIYPIVFILIKLIGPWLKNMPQEILPK